ncbi:peptidase S24-like protein [Barrientosiimonas humi]|uniref:Peptidase S24-like protein n=2 Tax=Barrientosiimonas TaxID=1535207 RepID=A0A542X9B6_9MICO|nr:MULTISPECIES: S26 family signal peptidase [Barrientosiimonas]TQL32437.1 peptidase S24-like protein [Barrientosiimonas humi]BDZ57197.1 hypothetical protein GCM10025872_08540 [Barrientosiimonas endolithica]CAG7572428.1 hypothetical protein BH39T_PBIAJDOK_01043 [Barrientosiimonas humi]
MPLPLGIAVVRGRSMEPTYVDGDRLLVRYGARVRAGRAHVVQLPAGPDGPRPLAVKRVVRAVGTQWWVESDRTDAPGAVDSRSVGPLPASAVVARVLLRLPRR